MPLKWCIKSNTVHFLRRPNATESHLTQPSPVQSELTRHHHPPPPRPQRSSGQYLARVSAFNSLTFLHIKIIRAHTIQIALSGLGDAATALLLVNLNDANLLERLHNLAVDAARGVHVVAGAHAAVLGRAVQLPQAADADRLAEVDVARDRGGADVEPVDILRRQLLGGTRLDGINPAFSLLVS